MLTRRRPKHFFILAISSLLLTIAASLAAKAESSSAQKVLVISDVDDTIKISYVRSKMEMVSFAAFSDSLFYGMNQVYQNLEKVMPAKFVYLSNGWTPTVEEVHQRLIQNFNFPEGEYLSRDNPLNKDFKFESISRLIEQEKPTLLIMVGDNGERDPVTYHRIERAFANRGIQFHTFIHKVYDRPQVEVAEASHSKNGLFPEQTEYLNSAELSDLFLNLGFAKPTDHFRLVKDIRDRVYEQKPYSVYGPLVSPYYQSHKPVSKKIICGKVHSQPTVADQMIDQIRERMAEVSPKGGS